MKTKLHETRKKQKYLQTDKLQNLLNIRVRSLIAFSVPFGHFRLIKKPANVKLTKTCNSWPVHKWAVGFKKILRKLLMQQCATKNQNYVHTVSVKGAFT